MSELFLLPGEFHFGNEYTTIKTLLGSCVAITMWSQRLNLGGMCHYKLPRRLSTPSVNLDGNYGEEAVLLFLKNMNRFMLKPADMTVGVFGAGNMFREIIKDDEKTVGVQNIRLAYQLLNKHGFSIAHESLGGDVSRKIAFDTVRGTVKVESLDVRQQKLL